MRNLPDVITALLAAIPETEASLRARLESLRSSALYAPPEAQPDWWRWTAAMLEEVIGEPKEEWQRKVVMIWVGVG